MRRHDFLGELHRRLRPRNYLEIGVNDGKSLALSRTPSIGIDPEFRVTRQIQCDVQLVRATSDAFFERADPIRHLRSGRNPIRNLRRGRPMFDHWRGGTTLDLAFIDGMHLFEFALRDFMNVERFSRPTSIIVMDDMLPRNIDEAARDRHTSDWTGDVFKVALVLRELRPDLILVPVDTEPTGVMVILGADAGSTVLRDQHDDLVERWATPDPQDIPADILARDGTYDPDALLGAPWWADLASARRGTGTAALERARAGLDALARR